MIDVDGVITNPPFNLATEFTLKALECTKEKRGQVAILNHIQWLEGIKRKKLFESNLPHKPGLRKVWVFSKRIPRMHRFDFEGKPGTSLICFAWFIFDWKWQRYSTLEWL